MKFRIRQSYTSPYIPATLAGFLLAAGCSPMQQLANVNAAGGAIANSLTGARDPGAGPQAAKGAQKREFSVGQELAFSAALSVLQDAGYRIQSADRATGLVTGVASSSERLTVGLGGLGRSSLTPVASLHIEQTSPESSIVRLTLVQMSGSSEQAISDPQPYAELFSALEQEIGRRKQQSRPREEVAEQPAQSVPAAERLPQDNTNKAPAAPAADPAQAEDTPEAAAKPETDQGPEQDQPPAAVPEQS